jgi:hypothetical protein
LKKGKKGKSAGPENWEGFPCFWKCSIITDSSFNISGIFSCSLLFFLNNFKIFQNSFGFYSYYQRES